MLIIEASSVRHLHLNHEIAHIGDMGKGKGLIFKIYYE